jgi:hypothetical protein
MRSIMPKFFAMLTLCSLAFFMDRMFTVVCADAVSAATSTSKSSRKPRKLTDAQLKKLQDRIAKRRSSRSGKSKGTTGVASVAGLYKEGEAAFKAENFAGAYEHFVDVAACRDVKGASGYAAKARARLLTMEKAAADKLEEAKLARLQGKGAESLEIVKVLLEKYPYTRAAAGANDLLITLSANPRVAAAVALVKAEESDKAARYAEAAKAYAGIMSKYPGTVQALKSKLRLKAMKADEEIAKAIKDAAKSVADIECPKLLIMARNYTMNKMYPQARALYEKLLKKYPASEYAAQAKGALKEISEQEKQKEKEKEAKSAAGSKSKK